MKLFLKFQSLLQLHLRAALLIVHLALEHIEGNLILLQLLVLHRARLLQRSDRRVRHFLSEFQINCVAALLPDERHFRHAERSRLGLGRRLLLEVFRVLLLCLGQGFRRVKISLV